MARSVPCEQCGNVTPIEKAERLIIEDRTHYFCSERCKIQWGEQPDVVDEE